MKAMYAVAAAAALLSFTGIRAATMHPSYARVATAGRTTGTAAAANDEQPVHQSYAGTIMLLNGSLYILRDDQNDIWYHLDDQEMPSKFLGKKVVVTGELGDANVIHVRDIEPATGSASGQ